MDYGQDASGLNMQALKMSILAGVTAGVSTLGIYMLAKGGDNDNSGDDESYDNETMKDPVETQEDASKVDEQDKEDLEAVKQLLMEELS